MALTGNPLQHSFPATGEYLVQLQVRDPWNRPANTSQTILVVVEPVPVPGFSWGSAQAGAATVFADATVVDPALELTYAWDFGDGGASTEADPEHTYAAAGTYSVQLTVTDQYNRSDSVTQQVEVSAPAEIWAELEADEPGVVPFVWDRRYGITESAGLISAWADPRPGRGATLAASGTERPGLVGGLPTFDGVDDRLAASLGNFSDHVNSGLYLMVVARVDSGSNDYARLLSFQNHRLMASAGTDLRTSILTGAGTYNAEHPSRFGPAAFPKLAHGIVRMNPVQIESRVESGHSSTWTLNNIGVNTTISSAASVGLGGEIWFLKGAIYQALIMTRPPTAAELEKIKAAAVRDHGANLTWT